MAERDTRNQKEIEEFILVNNEKNSTYMERNVSVRPIAMGKNGPVFEVLTQSNERIGIVGDDKRFKFDEKYKAELMKKMGPYFKQLALDSSALEADVIAMIEKQKNQDKERQQEERRKYEAQEELKKVNEIVQNKDENGENNKVKNMEVNSNEKQGNKDEEQLIMSKKEMEQYPRALIKDREYARQLVSNTDELDYYTVTVVMIDGYPKVMAQLNNTDNYVELPTYMGGRTEMGKIDSIEHGKEEEDIGRGNAITLINRNGELVTIDVRITNGGEVELRDASRDIDNDGDVDATRIETKSYTPAKPAASKVAEVQEEIDSKKKDELQIHTDEPLSNKQIKEMLDESEVSEDGRRNIIEKISGEINREELQNLIDNEIAREENEKEEDEEELEPGYTRGPGGELRFHGRPI